MNDVIAFMRIEPYVTGPTKKPMTNYVRLLDQEDRDVLRELAGYLQKDTNLHNRAWIKGIRSIKRESHPAAGTDPETERIVIDAEYREPVGFVVQGDAYLLVEKVTIMAGQKQAVRLPGVYSLQQRRSMAGLPMRGSGVDSSNTRSRATRAFTSGDAIAGLELAATLWGSSRM